jgi:hypothetical protein
MHTVPKLALGFAGLAFALPAPAQQQAASPNEPILIDKDRKVVCKNEQVTGSRFPTRSCKTVAEWDAIREQQLRDAHELLGGPVINTCRDSAC